MAIVPLRAKNEVADVDLPAIEAGEAAYGRLLHTWQAIANSPGMFATYLPFVRVVSGPGALDQRIKELVAVQVGLLNHCRYTTSHRCSSALKNGISQDELSAVAKGEISGFPERIRVALILAQKMTCEIANTSVAEEPTGVSDGTLLRAQEIFEPAQLVELLMSISVWNGLSRFHRVMGFELDMSAPPPDVDGAV
ncbi:carboxymuconolactone decarboxylase family protein [Streptomyces sp. NPDC004012]